MRNYIKNFKVVVFSILIISTSCGGFNSRDSQLPKTTTTEPNYMRFSKEVNYIPYYLEVYAADSLRMVGKNKEAFEKLEKLFKVYEPLNEINYEEYKNYLRLSYVTNRKSNIKENTIFFIKKFGYPYKRAKNDSVMNLIFNEIGIDENFVNIENNKL